MSHATATSTHRPTLQLRLRPVAEQHRPETVDEFVQTPTETRTETTTTTATSTQMSEPVIDSSQNTPRPFLHPISPDPHCLEKNQNGRRQNAVRPRPGPTAGSRQRRPARRCRRLSMPRRRPTRLGQAGRRTLPALRPRSRHRSPRRHRIGPPHGGQNDGRTERQLHPAGQRRLPNMATL